MRRCLLGFCIGVCGLGLVHAPPISLTSLALGTCTLAGILAVARRWAATCLCLGVAWGAWHNERALDERLPACIAGRSIDVDAVVLDAPTPMLDQAGQEIGSRLRIGIEAEPAGASTNACSLRSGQQLRMSWHGAPQIVRHERWRLSIRAKPPWSFQNPGGFDYERWLLGEGLAGTGYVRSGTLLQPAPRSRLRAARSAVAAALSEEGTRARRRAAGADAR